LVVDCGPTFPVALPRGSGIPQPAPSPSRSAAPRLLRDQLLSQMPASVSPLHAAPAGLAGTHNLVERAHLPPPRPPRRSLACTAKSYGPRAAKLTLVLCSGAARRCLRRAAPGGGQILPASPALPCPAAAPASRALPGSLHTEEARPPRPDAQRGCAWSQGCGGESQDQQRR
jgi:hypothetical protein